MTILTTLKAIITHDADARRIIMEYFEMKYKNEEICCRLQNKPVNLICFRSLSTRRVKSDSFKEYGCVVNQYTIDYDVDKDVFTSVNQNSEATYHLTYQMVDFLQSIDKTIDLIIDITNIEIRFLGILLYHLKKEHFCSVFCLYIMPERYKKKNPQTSKQKEEKDEKHELFDLYNNIGVLRGINGYLVENDNNLKEKNIILLGFEGGRTNRLCEQKDIKSLLPVITLPAFKPGWQNYALAANQEVLKKATSSNNLEYIAADSILSIYQKMNQWYTAYSDQFFLRISPLGTKINALGMLLYILNHPGSFDILYDNPMETKSNTEGHRDYIYFEITEILYQPDS